MLLVLWALYEVLPFLSLSNVFRVFKDFKGERERFWRVAPWLGHSPSSLHSFSNATTTHYFSFSLSLSPSLNLSFVWRAIPLLSNLCKRERCWSAPPKIPLSLLSLSFSHVQTLISRRSCSFKETFARQRVLLKPSEKKLYFCDYIFRLDRWRLKGTHTHTHTHTLTFLHIRKSIIGFFNWRQASFSLSQNLTHHQEMQRKENLIN